MSRRKKRGLSKKATPKSRLTRKMILDTAARVFAEHPYRSATLRMIGKEGGFNFTLINHYFSKSKLFETVAAGALRELSTAFLAWIDGLNRLGPKKGLSLFLDRALGYLFEQPQVILLLMQNLSQESGRVSIPGFELFTEYVAETANKMFQGFPLAVGQDRVVMWVYGLINMMISYIGFVSYHGQILGMDPRGNPYRKWVKDCLMYLFLPPLNAMFLPASDADAAGG